MGDKAAGNSPPAAPAGSTSDAPPTSSATPSATPHWTQPQPEEDDDDDSAYGDEAESSTASLSASILEYRTLHGRTYHSLTGNADYWSPNDERQSETMDILHHVNTMLIGDQLYLAPIGDSPRKVLDVGTGTGIWAIDFADKFPECEVIGTDISPNQPMWVPPNVKFEIDDCTQDWTFAPDSFDFVHIRFLFGSIPDWDALYREAFKALKPGGWIQAMETSVNIFSDDDTVKPGMAIHDWGPLFNRACDKVGRSMSVVDGNIIPGALERAGFVRLEERRLKCPLSPFGADPSLQTIGAYTQVLFLEAMEGFALHLFCNVLGWSREEVLIYLARVRKEIKNKHVHPYDKVQVVWAQKPLS